MIISRINTEEYIYFNVHAEESVTANYIEDDNRGIYGDRLQDITISRIIDSMDGSLKNIVYDFRYIEACQPNINRHFIDRKNAGYYQVFRNISRKLINEMALNSISNPKNVTDEHGDYETFMFFESDTHLLANTKINAKLLFENTFKQKLIPLINRHSEPHTSSFVYLTSYVDVKKFFSHEQAFMLYSIYRLAIKIRNEWRTEIEEHPILICQSMNSSFIVGILSIMLKLDILILDKIGPVNKLYNRLDKAIPEKRKYIVVSDLVCLGTEVKIVKNLIEFIGGQYLGNVSLIKTETLSKQDIRKENATKAVFSINRENNVELNYNIQTDLLPLP